MKSGATRVPRSAGSPAVSNGLAWASLGAVTLLFACTPVARPAASAPTEAPPKDRVRIGAVPVVGGAGIWIAVAKKYFEEEGIQPEITIFQTAADMVEPLGAGQLDVGGGAPGAGLSEAALQGVDIKIVADHATFLAGRGHMAIAARRDLYRNGDIAGPAGLKGRRFAISSTTGITLEAMLDRYMQRAGLSARDVDLVPMAFPDMLVAFATKTIDAGVVVEPFLTQIVEGGDAVILERGDTIYPDQQVTVILFSGQFAAKTDLAVRWMAAYLRGVRDYNDAFVKNDPTKRTEVVDILADYTPIKQKTLYDKMGVPGLNPNGSVNVASLQADQGYYISAKLQEKPADIGSLVDASFAEAAVRRLGRY